TGSAVPITPPLVTPSRLAIAVRARSGTLVTVFCAGFFLGARSPVRVRTPGLSAGGRNGSTDAPLVVGKTNSVSGRRALLTGSNAGSDRGLLMAHRFRRQLLGDPLPQFANFFGSLAVGRKFRDA